MNISKVNKKHTKTTWLIIVVKASSISIPPVNARKAEVFWRFLGDKNGRGLHNIFVTNTYWRRFNAFTVNFEHI